MTNKTSLSLLAALWQAPHTLSLLIPLVDTLAQRMRNHTRLPMHGLLPL